MASQMEPRGCARACGLARGGGPRRSQDRLGSVLFSSCRSGSLFWSSWAPLRVVFGRSGGRFGAFSAFQLIDSTRQLINSSIQLINSSTHQPMALRHFLTRPGGLRAARLNPPPPEGSERVQTVFEIFFEFLFEFFELKESSQAPRIPPGHASISKLASKIGPKSIQKLIKISMSFWSRFWRLLGPFWPPFWALLAAQIGPSSAQEAPRSPQDAPRWPQDRPGLPFFM